MRRGTTPTITITTDIDLSMASNLFVTFKQGNSIVFEKTLSGVTVTENTVICELSQEETLALKNETVRFQIRATVGGKKVASNIMSASVSEILKGGVI